MPTGGDGVRFREDRKSSVEGQTDAIDPGCVKTQKSKRDEE
jgi:hypothetical protein